MATINPFQGPANYAVDVQSPFESALGGFKLGAGMAEVQAAQQKRELEIAALAQAQRRQTELQNLYSNPNATSADFARVAAFLPKDQADRVIKGFEAQTAEQQQDTLSTGARAYAAVTSGNLDAARSLLLQKAEGLRNSGREKEAATFDDYSNMIALNPTGARANIGILMSTLPGGKQFLENADKALSTIRAEDQKGPTLAKLEAEALEKGVVAEFARPTAEANLAKLNKEKLAPSVQEAIDFANLTSDQQKTFSALQVLKKPAGAVTNVNVTNLEKTAEGELGKLVPDLYNQANSAASQLGDLPRYRKALGVAITGPLANVRLDANRIGEVLGFTGDTKINATRELIQGLSEMALKSRSMLTGQGAITDREQALLLQARSGDITFSKGELDTIFNVAERAAKAQYDKSKKLLSSAATKSPTAQMFLDNVEALPGAGALNPSEQSELDALRARFRGGRR